MFHKLLHYLMLEREKKKQLHIFTQFVKTSYEISVNWNEGDLLRIVVRHR